MANPLKIIEQGILAGDWSKVAKGYSALTGKTIKEPTTATTKVKQPKSKTVVKTKTVTVYKTDSSLLDILKFYQDAGNYELKNGRIEILFDGGEKARSYTIPDDNEESEEPEEIVPVKNTKQSKKSTNDEDDFFSPNYKPKPVLIKATGEDPHPDVKYPKNRVKEYRDANDSYDVVDHECAKCHKIQQFRKWETQKFIGDKPMDVICNKCNGGR